MGDIGLFLLVFAVLWTPVVYQLHEPRRGDVVALYYLWSRRRCSSAA